MLSTDPETIIIFLSIAIFKFATATYLAKRKVRESFNPQHVDAASSNDTLATKDFSVEDKEEKGNARQCRQNLDSLWKIAWLAKNTILL